jgi:hypothetical protein
MYYAVRSGLGLLREQASPPPLVGTDEIVQRYAAMTPGQQTAPGEVKRKVLTVFKALKIAIRNANHARERDASDFL